MRKRRLAVRRSTRAGWLVLPALVLVALAAPVHADWVSYSGAENARNIAEIHVEDDGVRVQLEVFPADLLVFERLVPDAMLEGLDVERPPTEERLRQFASEDLRIVADGTRTLPVEVRVAEPRGRVERYSPLAGKRNPLSGQLIPGPPEDKRVLYVELFYPFAGQPETLTFTPPLEDGAPRVTIGFVAWQGEVPLTDFRYLPPSTTLTLDWDDPWYSSFDHPNLKRWQRGPVQSFLYVEPLEVRHEILARLRNLEAWMDLGLAGREYVEAEENEALKARIGAFFLEREDVTVDGVRLEPILDRLDAAATAIGLTT